MKQPIYNTALYLRLSRDDEQQGDSGSIQTQRMMLWDYAQTHGLNVASEYVDDVWSGTNYDRPGFQKMIDDIEDGKINCVVTKDLSRFGRNYKETGNYLERIFPFLDVRFVAVNDHFDTLGAERSQDGYIIPLKNIMNDFYSRGISKKTYPLWPQSSRRASSSVPGRHTATGSAPPTTIAWSRTKKIGYGISLLK